MTAEAASQRLSRIAFWGLIALIAWAPLPLGSNRPWSWNLLSLCAGILLVIWALAALLDSRATRLTGKRLLTPAILFGLVVLWGMLQTSSLMPDAWSNPLWAEAERVLGPTVSATISVDPTVTVSGAIRLLAYGAIFWMAAQFGRDRDDARTILWCLVIISIAYAVYGLLVYSSGNQTILGYTKWAFPNDLTSTFVARSAYGVYAGLGLLVALALFVDCVARSASTNRERLSITGLIDALPPAFYALAVACTLLGTAMILSRSRGALAVTALGTLVMFAALLLRAGSSRGRMSLLLLAIGLGGLGLLEVSGGQTLGRFFVGAGQETGREAIHATAWRAIDAAPLTGHGLDTFRQIIYQYRTEALVDSWYRIDKAHSVYLELIAELGYIAFAVLMAALLWIVGVIASGLFRRRRDFIFPAVALGSIAMIGIHNLVDFSIQMPAIAATWSAMLGIGYAQSWGSEDAFGNRLARNRGQKPWPVTAARSRMNNARASATTDNR